MIGFYAQNTQLIRTYTYVYPTRTKISFENSRATTSLWSWKFADHRCTRGVYYPLYYDNNIRTIAAFLFLAGLNLMWVIGWTRLVGLILNIFRAMYSLTTQKCAYYCVNESLSLSGSVSKWKYKIGNTSCFHSVWCSVEFSARSSPFPLEDSFIA